MVRIVTDSTADLPEEIRKDYGIEIVPLNVHFGDERYLDHVEITPQQFYEKLRSFSGIPRTSQPSPGDFAAIYRGIAAESGSSIISIHLSSLLSGTHQSAVIARDMLADEGIDVAVVDGRTASSQTGALAVIAARAVRAGKSKDEVVKLIEKVKAQVRVLFIVDTLEYLQKNGRIGRAAGLIGGLLKIKPLLEVADGVVSPVEKIRGSSSKAFSRMVDLIEESVAPSEPQVFYVIDSACPEKASEVCEELHHRFGSRVSEMILSSIGPVIGTHVGPGTVGVIWHSRSLWL